MNHQATPEASGNEVPQAALTVQPAETPASLGQDAKYCPLCPGWYRLRDVKAKAPDGSITEATKVILPVFSGDRTRRLFRTARADGQLTRSQRADIAAQNYHLECPRRHSLVNSQEPTAVVGVIGNVNSSKSHFIAGLVYELIHEQRLAAYGADVGYIGDTGAVMDQRIDTVYRKGEILPNTERNQIDGPFTYRLTRDASTVAESKTVLTFFDVAGEDCVGLARSAEFVRYLFGATGIILLIDPDGLPFPGRPLEPRGDVPLATRAIIDNLADAMAAVTGTPSREQPQIISITIAKADIADLPADVWPPKLLESSPEHPPSTSEARAALKSYSDACRTAFRAIGGQAIISAAETRFDPRNVFYSAISATNQIPLEGRWCGARPSGCSIPLAEILWFGESL